ncbi:helix-turn-helix domain-containing protein [Companilactobacillus sp.]|uniref:helix-turn-helix domain-containing protein n=1 Tax=Companilactobacillus sp. TaxID=2767905 RepID=UPI0025C362B6|nr:helix-turn-helix transcriptional regulator [Companilactobacillus sp.]MCH4010024.1 helix-turn-helix transcriptional regulator [Companilactobacillus sp.]MCH4052300.1 helix-turn-helix transcriptional regulator [Companilactobacillus sp.]MCH4077966.1 helix-turn-helix transcriptional regulator [Companilactobacillus sp.]MCH4126542.1 helix-turn-helix transcriptional regulator [Companilactobacillus sp.]MCH4132128.1 helix-turn-helix transcriptional regulator [Companilactobacillus sp.]
MNIQSFIDKRKEMGLSQKELSKGICTQATLSKFENNGKIPSMKILIQLCNRLNLALDDIIGLANNGNKDQIKAMNKAEFNLIIEEYQNSWDILNSIDLDSIKEDKQATMQFYYLQGYLNVLDDGDLLEAVFDFNQILSDLDTEGETIFTFLAFVGMGMVYGQQGDNDKSEYYFSKVFNDIYGMQIDDVTKIWRYVNIIFYCSLYYSERKELETANTLLDYGLKICQDNHVTYYVARIYEQLAINECEVNGKSDKVLDLLDKAKVFSEFNHNENELVKIRELIKDCK